MTIPFRARPETLLSSSLAIIESVQWRTFYVCCNRRDGAQQQRDTSHGICSQGRTSLLLARQRVLDFVERRRSDLSGRRAHQRFVRSAAGEIGVSQLLHQPGFRIRNVFHNRNIAFHGSSIERDSMRVRMQLTEYSLRIVAQMKPVSTGYGRKRDN